jgi:hypothetical protein
MAARATPRGDYLQGLSVFGKFPFMLYELHGIVIVHQRPVELHPDLDPQQQPDEPESLH